MAAAAAEPGHDAQGFGGQAGVDLRQDRLKDTLGSVQAGLEIGLGPGLNPGNHFFRGHLDLLIEYKVAAGFTVNTQILQNPMLFTYALKGSGVNLFLSF